MNLFADPAMLNHDTPLWVFAAFGLAASTAGGTIIYIALKAAAHDRRLMQEGVQRTGIVTILSRIPMPGGNSGMIMPI